METSLKAPELLVSPQPDETCSLDPELPEREAAACASSGPFDPMQEFSQRLEDIIRTHGSADDLQLSSVGADTDRMEVKGDTVAMETDVSVIKQSLNNLLSPEEKLEELIRKHAELAVLRCSDGQKLIVLQQKLSVLTEERQQLHAERRSSNAARCKLETLCRELQAHYNMLREDTLRRCREDDEKRKEITTHFQETLTEIQDQIEQHSARNDKLCRENSNLTDKLESLMTQYERREESLEKINKHRDLQHKLTEAKLQQANALLGEAEDKHKREKEYLLIQAAEWKLQAKTLKEQETVLQAQLTLYAQKFDEFQETLAKSNEIYVHFKKEMDNMTEKMKKVEKESNLWKTRFENCNKALTDMIEERTEKGKEFDLFVLKIQKLEKLCRALQEERKGLYEKIKEVCISNANLPSKISHLTSNAEVSDQPPPLDPEEIQKLQEEDQVLTENIVRLKEEQAKLQEFAASLLVVPEDNKEQAEYEELNVEEDMVVSAFVKFKTKTLVKEDLVSVPDQVENGKSETEESGLSQIVRVEEVQNPSEASSKVPAPKDTSSDETERNPAGREVQDQDQDQVDDVQNQDRVDKVPIQTRVYEVLAQAQVDEMQQSKAAEDIQQPVASSQEPERTKTGLEPQELKSKILAEAKDVKPELPLENQQVQQQLKEPASVPEESVQALGDKPADSSEKSAPKKKKKSNKSAS